MGYRFLRVSAGNMLTPIMMLVITMRIVVRMVIKLGWVKISPRVVGCMSQETDEVWANRNGADGESRTPTDCSIRPSSALVYQVHHIGVIV